jgi:serine/threonine protein kinase
MLTYAEHTSAAYLIYIFICGRRSFGPFPEPVLAQYTRQIMEGLAYIHEHQVFVSSLFFPLSFFPLVLAQYTRQIMEGLAYIHEHQVMLTYADVC